jgi:hypothetical protein
MEIPFDSRDYSLPALLKCVPPDISGTLQSSSVLDHKHQLLPVHLVSPGSPKRPRGEAGSSSPPRPLVPTKSLLDLL